MGGMDIGRRRAASLRRLHGPDWYQSGPGLVIDFCTSPVRTDNSTYPGEGAVPLPSKKLYNDSVVMVSASYSSDIQLGASLVIRFLYQWALHW